MVSLYCGGPVDFNEKTYYDIIEGLIEDKVPVILFRPGMAFKVKGEVDPKYLVDVNLEAMLRSDLIVFYINDSRTTGVWLEAAWALQNKKRMLFYVEPGVRQSLYMRWVAAQVNSEWISDIQKFGDLLNQQISEIASGKGLVEISDVCNLGSTGDCFNFTGYKTGGGCKHER
jgi:hypothetical protein